MILHEYIYLVFLLSVATSSNVTYSQVHMPETSCTSSVLCQLKPWKEPYPQCIGGVCTCVESCISYTEKGASLYYYCGDCGHPGSYCNLTLGLDCLKPTFCDNDYFCHCNNANVIMGLCVLYQPVSTSSTSFVLIFVLVAILILQRCIASRKRIWNFLCCRRNGGSVTSEEMSVIGFNPASYEKSAAFTAGNSDFLVNQDDSDLDWTLDLARSLARHEGDWVMLEGSEWSSRSSTMIGHLEGEGARIEIEGTRTEASSHSRIDLDNRERAERRIETLGGIVGRMERERRRRRRLARERESVRGDREEEGSGRSRERAEENGGRGRERAEENGGRGRERAQDDDDGSRERTCLTVVVDAVLEGVKEAAALRASPMQDPEANDSTREMDNEEEIQRQVKTGARRRQRGAAPRRMENMRIEDIEDEGINIEEVISKREWKDGLKDKVQDHPKEDARYLTSSFSLQNEDHDKTSLSSSESSSSRYSSLSSSWASYSMNSIHSLSSSSGEFLTGAAMEIPVQSLPRTYLMPSPAPRAAVTSHITSSPAPRAVVTSHITSSPAPRAAVTSHITSSPAPRGAVTSHITSSPACQTTTTINVMPSLKWRALSTSPVTSPPARLAETKNYAALSPARRTAATNRTTSSPSRQAATASHVTSSSSRQAATASHVTSSPSRQAATASHVTSSPSRQAATASHVTSSPSRQAASASHVTSSPSRQAATDSHVTSSPSRQAATASHVTSSPSRQASINNLSSPVMLTNYPQIMTSSL